MKLNMIKFLKLISWRGVSTNKCYLDNREERRSVYTFNLIKKSKFYEYALAPTLHTPPLHLLNQ